MKLGVLTAPFAQTPLGEVASWASVPASRRWKSPCWPKSSGASRRYAGTSHIDAASTSATQAKEIVASLAEKNLSVSGLGYYPNPLHPDADPPRGGDRPFEESDRAGRHYGVPVVNTFCGRRCLENRRRQLAGGAQGLARNRRPCARPWRQARLRELPDDLQPDEWPGGHNIAYSPQVWRRILEAWGGEVGMNFDPSHLVWQMIDQARFIREFGPTCCMPTPRT